MLKRTVTGAFITVFVYLIIYYSHIPAVILSATTVLSAIALYEVYRATGLNKNHTATVISVIVAAVIICLPIPHYNVILGVVFVLAIGVFAGMMYRQKQCRFDNAVKSIGVALLIVLLFKAFPEFHAVDSGVYYLTFAVTTCFVTDIAAYLIGRFFGKHKLLPSVSPNKTVEGSIAGVVFTMIVMLLCGGWVSRATDLSVNYGLLGIYAVLASVIGQFGDLAMSVVKRICGIKDFGKLFPGHGGVLDRFDSHLFSVAFTLLLCSVTGGFLA